MKTKVCTKCGEEKPLEYFSKSKSGKYGKEAICKQCRSSYHKEYNNRLEVKQKETNKYKSSKINLDKDFLHKTIKFKACHTCHKLKQIDSFLFRNDRNKFECECKDCSYGRTRKWSKENKLHRKNYRSKKKAEDPDEFRRRNREEYLRNIETYKEYSKKRYAAYSEEEHAIKNKLSKEHTKMRIRELRDSYVVHRICYITHIPKKEIRQYPERIEKYRQYLIKYRKLKSI